MCHAPMRNCQPQSYDQRTKEVRDKPPANLSLKQRLVLKVFGKVYLRHEKRQGWKHALPIYLTKCPIHGYFEDYPHGWEGYFQCPQCWKIIRVEG